MQGMSSSLRDYFNKQNYIKAVKRAQRMPQMNPHIRICRTTTTTTGPAAASRKVAGALAVTATATANTSGTCHRSNSNYTAETTTTMTTATRRRSRTSLRMKMSLSSSSGGGNILLALLAAVLVVIFGTDAVKSESELLQQITSATAAIGNEILSTPSQLTEASTNATNATAVITGGQSAAVTVAATATTATLANTTTATQSSAAAATIRDADAETITAIQWSSTTIEPVSTLPPEVDFAILNAALPVNDTDLDAEDSLAQPASDSLTKGFSIPTFLPPFPEFAMADLPAYTSLQVTTTTTTTTRTESNIRGAASLSPDMLQEQQDQLYLAAYNKHHLPKRNLTLPSTNVTVQTGSHAYMPCHIRRLLNKPVSWVRVRDGHILTVDQTTFIADQRFQSIFRGENEYTWSLQIKYVQQNDEGWYECQVSTEPKMSAKVHLGVVVPRTELIGDQNRFVKAGSKVALHCIVRGTLEPPTYIIWYRGKTQIMDDNKIGWYTQIDRNIFGNTSDNQNTIGSLIIPFVRKLDSGNYTCQPSNSAGVSVDLHVLSGEYSASAIMSAARTHKLDAYYLLLILLLVAQQKT